jgi:large conductance mechanosensitive channel
MLKGFKQFILRGNVIDLAIGVVIGASFNSVVSAFVKDLFTPLIAAIIKNPDFSNLHWEINGSRILYGDFLNTVISFLIVAVVAYFFVIVPMNTLMSRVSKEEPADPAVKKCPYCTNEISIEAKKCPYCTANL